MWFLGGYLYGDVAAAGAREQCAVRLMQARAVQLDRRAAAAGYNNSRGQGLQHRRLRNAQASGCRARARQVPRARHAAVAHQARLHASAMSHHGARHSQALRTGHTCSRIPCKQPERVLKAVKYRASGVLDLDFCECLTCRAQGLFNGASCPGHCRLPASLPCISSRTFC